MKGLALRIAAHEDLPHYTRGMALRVRPLTLERPMFLEKLLHCYVTARDHWQ